MIEIDKLKKYASKLMFDMKEEEYQTLRKEFENLENEMELISKYEGLNKVDPMCFPFPLEGVIMNDDEIGNTITNEEALLNVKEKENGEVKLPKVVASNDN